MERIRSEKDSHLIGLEKIAPGVQGIEKVEFIDRPGVAVTSFSQVTRILIVNNAALVGFRKFIEGGLKGSEKKYGTAADKQARWSEFQTFIENKHRLHPGFSYNFLTKMAARCFGVAQKTIYRHTHNPR